MLQINKDELRTSGIYCFYNFRSQKVYVGQSQWILARFRTELYGLRGKYHHNRHLQSSWNQHGEDSFEFFVLEILKIDDLTEAEQFWLDYFKSLGCEAYNFGNDVSKPARGYKFSDATKEKRRLMNTGVKFSLERCIRISESNKGKIDSPETLRKKQISAKLRPPVTLETAKKISNSLVGKPKSEEHKKKLSLVNLGKLLSPETKEKLRIANIGRVCSEETRKKLRARVVPKEVREATSKRCKGIPRAEEVKKKISNKLVYKYVVNSLKEHFEVFGLKELRKLSLSLGLKKFSLELIIREPEGRYGYRVEKYPQPVG